MDELDSLLKEAEDAIEQTQLKPKPTDHQEAKLVEPSNFC